MPVFIPYQLLIFVQDVFRLLTPGGGVSEDQMMTTTTTVDHHEDAEKLTR